MSKQVRDPRASGFTLLEVIVVMGIFSVFMAGAITMVNQTMRSFTQSQIVANLAARSQHAIERLTNVIGQAVSGDPLYSPMKPDTGVDSKVLRFRLIQTITAGVPVYDDNLRIYVMGVDSGSYPCAGVVIGRGPSMSGIHSAAAGTDGVLGTEDDDVALARLQGLLFVLDIVEHTQR